MKSFLFSVAALMLTFTFALPQVAEAKRFGGGGSFGKQKSMPAQQRQAPSQTQKAAQTPRQNAAGQAVGSAKWLGPLAGLAAGGFLAWMIFGEGFEAIQFMDILLIALLIMGLMMFLRARQRQQHAAAESTGYASNQLNTHQAQATQTRQAHSLSEDSLVPVIGSGLGASAQHQVNAPDWFDETPFLEGAKQHFMAIQKAWDQGDAAEIESYCTPELFAELQALMQQVQAGENQTQVDTLYTEILDQSFEDDYFVVSLGFSGFIKEDATEPAHAFNEIWHIRRLAEGQGDWQIAGIQQVYN